MELVPAIVARARNEHPDTVPCVIALPLTGGHPAYRNWGGGRDPRAVTLAG